MRTTRIAGALALLLGGCQTGGEAKPPAAVASANAPTAGWMTPPAVPPSLAVPPGAMLKLHAHGAGAQIYICAAVPSSNGTASANAWVLKAPDAKLYDAGGAQIGTHGAGPSWSANDGSAVSAKKIAESPAPVPDAIAWLLLRGSSNRGTGTFGDVTYVQRLTTGGGKAPPGGCDAGTLGTTLQVNYTAEYYFYTGSPAQAAR